MIINNLLLPYLSLLYNIGILLLIFTRVILVVLW